MRKILPFTIGLLAVVAGGAAVYLQKKPAAGLLSARPSVAQFLPAGTLLLLSAPDPGQSAADWKTTDLYKIWTEPEVQAFLEKPLGQIPPNSQVAAAFAGIAKVEPRNAFIALTALDEKDNRPHLLAGFQFKGDSKGVDALLAKPKGWLRQSQPAAKADLINYQGRAIETLDAADGNTVASVYLDDWYLVGNDLTLLKSAVDHLERRAPATPPMLDQDAAFQSVCGKLPSGHETLIFARVQPFMARVFALAAAAGQPVPPESRAEAEKIQAVGATTRIEDGKIRDTIYELAPGIAIGKLGLTSLPLTSADTLLYAALAFKWPATMNLPALPGTPASAALATLDQWAEALKARGVTLDTARAALADEASFQIDWPAAAQQPGALVSFDVRDHAAAQKLLDGLTAVPLDGPAWQKKGAADGALYTLNLPGAAFVTPALTLTDKHLIAGLNPDGVQAAAARDRAGAATALAQNPGYKTVTAAVVKPNVAFGYFDARAFFDRAYGVLKPAAVMGAALFAPQINDYVELGKLPAAETISRHLSPTVFSEASDAEGVTVESYGSVTLAQAVLGVSGVVGGVAAPILQKQYSAPTPPPTQNH